ncbi:hypothetical protein ACNKHL_19805 [Shigella flexneri]
MVAIRQDCAGSPKSVAAVGHDPADAGRTPGDTAANCPMKDGVIADLLRY